MNPISLPQGFHIGEHELSAVDWGSVADWFAGAATFLAALAAVALARRSETVRRRELQEHSRSQARYVRAVANLAQRWNGELRAWIWDSNLDIYNDSIRKLVVQVCEEMPVALLNAAAEQGIVFNGSVPENIVEVLDGASRLKGSAAAIDTLIREGLPLVAELDSRNAPNRETSKAAFEAQVQDSLDLLKLVAARLQTATAQLKAAIAAEYNIKDIVSGQNYELTPGEKDLLRIASERWPSSRT